MFHVIAMALAILGLMMIILRLLASNVSWVEVKNELTVSTSTGLLFLGALTFEYLSRR